MQFTPKPPLWARTPPAIFPPILGLLGIGLAWRRAYEVIGAPQWIGEMLLGAVSLLFVFAMVAYLSKIVRRPSVIMDDLKILPGRAGISAASVALMLFAAAMVPYAPEVARVLLGAAVVSHTVLAILVITVLLRGPSEMRVVTPIWHLSFVGFIVLPISGVPLGYIAASTFIFWATMPIAAAIWGISLVQFIRRRAPEPLRPLFAIHLAPMCLFTIVGSSLGYQHIALCFATAAVILLAVFLVSVRWLTKAGFSPLWGAFTFPMAAFCNAMLAVEPFAPSAYGFLGKLAVALGSIAVIWIAFKIMQLWTKGKLAVVTNAAQA